MVDQNPILAIHDQGAGGNGRGFVVDGVTGVDGGVGLIGWVGGGGM